MRISSSRLRPTSEFSPDCPAESCSQTSDHPVERKNGGEGKYRVLRYLSQFELIKPWVFCCCCFLRILLLSFSILFVPMLIVSMCRCFSDRFVWILQILPSLRIRCFHLPFFSWSAHWSVCFDVAVKTRIPFS